MPLSGPSSVTEVVPQDGAVRVQHDGDRTVAWLGGEHDASTVDVLARTVAAAVAFDDADLVVDLREVTFMGAATVGVLFRARDLLGLRSRHLALRDPSASARRLLCLCGLADLIERVPGAMTHETGSVAPALGTWVAVPASDRVEHGRDLSSAEPQAR
jgi:anti-anti-sigma factor